MKDPLSLMSPKREYMHILFMIIFLTSLESRSQYCRSKNGRKICCSGFWYEKKNNQCLKCPDGYYGQNCSDLCPFPYFGELCKHICNCSSALCHRVRGCFPERSESALCGGIDGVTCCRNYWYNEESHECVECNPGYFGTNCMEKCPFPLYGAHCDGNCNCSEEDCNHATGCSIQNIEIEDKKSIRGRIEELSQKRIWLRVSVYVLISILIGFVIMFIAIELHQRTRGRIDEQMICTDNEPAYQEITINEENGDLFISEHEHFLNEPTDSPPEIETNKHNEMAEMKKSILIQNHRQDEAIELPERHSRCDSITNYSKKSK